MSSNFERKFPHKFGNFCKFLCNYGHLAVIAYGTGCNFCFPLCYRYLKQSIASIPKSFLKGSTLVSFSFIFGLFQTNNTFFYNKSTWKYIHPVYSAGIRTHDLLNMSRLPLPLGQGFRPNHFLHLVPDGHLRRGEERFDANGEKHFHRQSGHLRPDALPHHDAPHPRRDPLHHVAVWKFRGMPFGTSGRGGDKKLYLCSQLWVLPIDI